MGIKNLMGSLAKDLFKWWHKQIPGAEGWYACDIDLSLLNRNGILCIQDYKHGNDTITWTEKRGYKDLYERGLPIYIIKDTGRAYNYSDIVLFSKNSLREQLRGLGVSETNINIIINTNVEETLKKDTINTMTKNLSVWDYIPNNSEKGYSSKLISNDYIEWEADLRKRRLNV
jgi:hypothetical protein